MRCEKCWNEARQIHFSKQSKSITDEYWKILETRNCTLKEQCGEMHEIDRLGNCYCGKKEGEI